MSRAAASALALAALAMPAAAGIAPRATLPGLTVVPVVSSNANRPDAYGNYGGLKRTTPLPGRPIPTRPIPYRIDDGRAGADRDRIKPPYPYPYYKDTSRGNYGCYRYARRGIDTNNRNWLTRYRECIEARKSTD